METLRLLRWKVSLVAMLALLLHSFMPVLMPARAASGGSPADWIEVCTGGKVQFVPASALNADAATADPGKGSIAKTALDHCSFCSYHCIAAVRSESGREPPAVSVRKLPLYAALDVADPHFAWATAHTRSPPSLN
jgi:hypothetical protein